MLDGRSIWRGKLLNVVGGEGGTSPLLMSFRLGFDETGPMPVGTEGRENSGFSSSSSMEGKCCVNPERSKVVLSCGEDEGEDAGDGGPKEEVGTNV